MSTFDKTSITGKHDPFSEIRTDVESQAFPGQLGVGQRIVAAHGHVFPAR